MSDNQDPWDQDPNRITDRDEIAALLDDYYGQTDPTGQSQIDEEYYDMLPQEMQWLIEDQETFRSLVRDYLNGDITFEQLQIQYQRLHSPTTQTLVVVQKLCHRLSSP